MLAYDGLQYAFLIQGDIDKQDMLAFVQLLLEAFEIRVRFLNAYETALPGTKSQYDDGEKYGGYPGISFREAREPCDK